MKKLNRKQKIILTGMVIIIFIILLTDSLLNSKNRNSITYKQYVKGMKDWTVEVGVKDIDYLENVTWDKQYIDEVSVNDEDVDLAKEGNYDLVYIIDVKDKDSKDIKVEKEVKVVSKEEAQKAVKEGKEVVTQESVQKGETKSKDKKEDSKSDSKEEPKSKSKADTSSENEKQNATSKASENTGKAASSEKKDSTSAPVAKSESKPVENKPSQNSKPTHKHKWVEQFKTVHHDEVSHEEEYVIKAAWMETVPKYETQMHTFCLNPTCGRDLTASGEVVWEHAQAHALKYESDSTGQKPVQVQVGTDTINHRAETGTRKVVDKAAFDEKVVSGYKCSCGATK